SITTAAPGGQIGGGGGFGGKRAAGTAPSPSPRPGSRGGGCGRAAGLRKPRLGPQCAAPAAETWSPPAACRATRRQRESFSPAKSHRTELDQLATARSSVRRRKFPRHEAISAAVVAAEAQERAQFLERRRSRRRLGPMHQLVPIPARVEPGIFGRIDPQTN